MSSILPVPLKNFNNESNHSESSKNEHSNNGISFNNTNPTKLKLNKHFVKKSEKAKKKYDASYKQKFLTAFLFIMPPSEEVKQF